MDVHAARPDDLLAVHPDRLRSRDQPRAADAVAAHVHEGAALEGLREPDVGLVRDPEAERGVHGSQLPQARQQLDELARLRRVAPHEGFLEDQASGFRSIERRGHVGWMAGIRLLAQDVLASRQRLQRPGVVQRVGQHEIDGLHVGVGEQGLVGAMHSRDGVLRGEGPATRRGAAAHRQDLDLVRQAGPGEQLGGDAAGPQEAPADPLLAHGRVVRWSGRSSSRAPAHPAGPNGGCSTDPNAWPNRGRCGRLGTR